jgi:hypothetical protein
LAVGFSDRVSVVGFGGRFQWPFLRFVFTRGWYLILHHLGATGAYVQSNRMPLRASLLQCSSSTLAAANGSMAREGCHKAGVYPLANHEPCGTIWILPSQCRRVDELRCYVGLMHRDACTDHELCRLTFNPPTHHRRPDARLASAFRAHVAAEPDLVLRRTIPLSVRS